jgi:hypothetical protein
VRKNEMRATLTVVAPIVFVLLARNSWLRDGTLAGKPGRFSWEKYCWL